MQIPFLDLKLINQAAEQEIIESVTETIKSGWYVLGKKLETFENQFAAYCQAKHCVGVANGLDAISLILKAYDFPIDSEVIVPANTYIASILGILQANLKPVLVEPNPTNYLLDERTVEKHITDKTKAILAVELYGKSSNLPVLRSLADTHKLKLVTDSAQSHGATFSGKATINWVNASAYSFYPTKNLGALGDAGAIITNDDALAERVKYLRNYGSYEKYKFEFPSINSRLDEIQAGILSLKLTYLNKQTERRRQIARRYLQEIENEEITLPPNNSIDDDVWHLFVIRCKHRDELKSYLVAAGIGTDVHYPIPPHKQKALAEFNHHSYPISEQLHREVLSIPMNHTLTEEQINYIISILNAFVCP